MSKKIAGVKKSQSKIDPMKEEIKEKDSNKDISKEQISQNASQKDFSETQQHQTKQQNESKIFDLNVSKQDDLKMHEKPKEFGPDEILRRQKAKQNSENLNKYLEATGISQAFKVIFAEVIAKELPRDQALQYMQDRLREIGNEVTRVQLKAKHKLQKQLNRSLEKEKGPILQNVDINPKSPEKQQIQKEKEKNTQRENEKDKKQVEKPKDSGGPQIQAEGNPKQAQPSKKK